MIIRGICGIIIILGGGYTGMLFSAKLYEKVKQIEVFEKMLSLLLFNIDFMAMPLSRAMLQISGNLPNPANKLLLIAGGIMKNRPDAKASQCWKEAIDRCRKDILLNNDEIEILYSFGENMDSSEKENCVANINITLAKLKFIKEEAFSKFKKDGNMWRGMGFLVGILIVILLI